MKAHRLKLAKGLSKRKAWNRVRNKTGLFAKQVSNFTYNAATGWARWKR